MRQLQQAISFTAHGREYDDDLIPVFNRLLDPIRHTMDALDRANRGPSVLLDNQGHNRYDPLAKRRTTNFVASRGAVVEAFASTSVNRRPATREDFAELSR